MAGVERMQQVEQNFNNVSPSRTFHQRNYQYLLNLNYPIKDLPYEVPHDISVLCHQSALYRDDWKRYARRMGIADNFAIARIEAAAFAMGEIPLYLALTKVLHDSSYAVIIDCMLDMHRDDILSYLEKYTRGILNLNGLNLDDD